MSVSVEAIDLIRKLAEPCPAGDTKKAAILRVWRKLPAGWTFNRSKDVFAGRAEISLSERELNELRGAVAARTSPGLKAAQEKDNFDARWKKEREALEARICRLEAILSANTPNVGPWSDRAGEANHNPR